MVAPDVESMVEEGIVALVDRGTVQFLRQFKRGSVELHWKCVLVTFSGPTGNMEDVFGNTQQYSVDALTKYTPLTRDVSQHLVKVYSTLGLALCAAAAGSVFHLYTNAGGLLSFLGAFAMLMWLLNTPAHEVQKRTQILFLFAGLKGLSIGPLVEAVLEIDPRIVITALLGTAAVFACFSGAAVLAQRRQYLYLGALASSALSTLTMLAVINMFWRSDFLLNISLYGGLIMFSVYIIVDTQMIVEKASAGVKDHVRDALQLFVDLIAIFVRLMVILSKLNKDNKREK